MSLLAENIFVTGIGTGVGKTVASAVLVTAFQADYWKPIQCGSLENSDTMVIDSLVSRGKDIEVYPEAYSLKTASSPHYAAQMEGVKIELAKCLPPPNCWPRIIEGAGGLMVPLNESECIIDLIGQMQAHVILVCRNYLGSINHTLLSIHLLRQRGIKLGGLIISGDNFLDNEEIIQKHTGVTIIGRINEAPVIDKTFIENQASILRPTLVKLFGH